jgi:hypothetical protein
VDSEGFLVLAVAVVVVVTMRGLMEARLVVGLVVGRAAMARGENEKLMFKTTL